MRLFWDGLSEVKDNLLAWPQDKDLAALIGCQRKNRNENSKKKKLTWKGSPFFYSEFRISLGAEKESPGGRNGQLAYIS